MTDTPTVEVLRAIQDATIPELRWIWNYGRDGERSERALARLVHLGQVGPDGRPCVWGTVLHHHEIGDFTILETQRDQAYYGTAPDGTNRRIEPEEEADARAFHIYVNGKNLCRSTHNLDSALLRAITWKYESMSSEAAAANSQAASYYQRMIGMEV